MFYRACLVYYHTSMYRGQSLAHTPEVEEGVATCAREIIQIVNMVLDRRGTLIRFAVFPLFMAGMASKVLKEKKDAVRFIGDVENMSFGSKKGTTKRLLISICNKQLMAAREMGHQGYICWQEELEAYGQQSIILGL